MSKTAEGWAEDLYESCANDVTEYETEADLRSALVAAAAPMFAAAIAAARADALAAPIPMLLWCPRCHLQHIDEPSATWANPSHKTHLCQGCGHLWRPAEVPTNGVAALAKGGT